MSSADSPISGHSPAASFVLYYPHRSTSCLRLILPDLFLRALIIDFNLHPPRPGNEQWGARNSISGLSLRWYPQHANSNAVNVGRIRKQSRSQVGIVGYLLTFHQMKAEKREKSSLPTTRFPVPLKVCNHLVDPETTNKRDTFEVEITRSCCRLKRQQREKPIRDANCLSIMFFSRQMAIQGFLDLLGIKKRCWWDWLNCTYALCQLDTRMIDLIFTKPGIVFTHADPQPKNFLVRAERIMWGDFKTTFSDWNLSDKY